MATSVEFNIPEDPMLFLYYVVESSYN